MLIFQTKKIGKDALLSLAEGIQSGIPLRKLNIGNTVCLLAGYGTMDDGCALSLAEAIESPNSSLTELNLAGTGIVFGYVRDAPGAQALLHALLPVYADYKGPNAAVRPGWRIDSTVPGRLWLQQRSLTLTGIDTATRLARPSLRSLNLAGNTLCGRLSKAGFGCIDGKIKANETPSERQYYRHSSAPPPVVKFSDQQPRLSFEDINATAPRYRRY